MVALLLAAAFNPFLSAATGTNVACPSFTDWAPLAAAATGSADHGGVYLYSEAVVVLSPGVCDTLNRLDRSPPADMQLRAWEGFTIFLLAHELQHAAGVTDEAEADCGAARAYQRVAHMLDVDGAVSFARASRYFDGYDPPTTQPCWRWLTAATAD